MIYAQMFCTLAEVDADLNLLGSERENILYGKLRAACDFLREELGWFIPVTRTVQMRTGNPASPRLFVPPVLSLDSITNYSISLTTADYIFGPDARMWTNGPYTWLERAAFPARLGEWSCLPNGIVLTGKWGMYCATEAAETQLAVAQDAVQTYAVVKDGSKVSPGMVMLLDSEQQLVTATGAVTAAVTTLAADLDASSELATLTSGAAVKIGEIIRMGLEQMKVVDINGNAVYLVRGWNKTQKVLHAAAAPVDVYRTFTVLRGVNGTLAALHLIDLDLLRYVVPGDVNMLAREIAGKMLKFAQGGFAGKIGDPTSGQVEYNFAIPRADVAQIKSNYYIPNAR